LGLPKNAQTIKWSLNALKKEAAKHQRLELFRRANPGAYQTAWRKGWLGELGLKRGLALQEVSEIAEQYFTRTAFYKGSRRAYDAAKLNGWLDSLLPRYAVRAPRV
jgi:hypothetical protein